ncbi:MAG: sigma-70 family RNA polymerase sigma factor, partial [Bacteroides sp.]|nr:sigma-70 family RNA polymerase sigma factor [Bacteroides sp.]
MLFFKRNISKLSDEELLIHYTKSGDTEYFGELYNRYIPLLYGLCLQLLRKENKEIPLDYTVNIMESDEFLHLLSE